MLDRKPRQTLKQNFSFEVIKPLNKNKTSPKPQVKLPNPRITKHNLPPNKF